MQPATEYRMTWDTMPFDDVSGTLIASQSVQASIYDMDNLIDDSDTPVVIELTPAGNPLTISTINNAQDKYQPIRSKQAVLRFLTDRSQYQDASTFADGSDKRWKVVITVDSIKYIFVGFVQIADVQEPYLPDPVVVELTCTDFLGSLKDVPWSLDDGSVPSGKYKLGVVLAQCLKKTGLSLGIIAVNNLRHGTGAVSPTETIFIIDSGDNQIRLPVAYAPYFYEGMVIAVTGSASNNTNFTVNSITQDATTVYLHVKETPTAETSAAATLTDGTSALHFYDGIYVDALTFEKDINEMEDCYEVISRILGYDCYITQYNNKWYIIRIDEFDGNNLYPATFDSDGVFVSFDAADSYTRQIGSSEIIKFARADQNKRFERPHRFDKLTYKFNYPKELPCNVDYSRGDASTDPDIQLTDYAAYELDCWEVYHEWGASRTAGNFKASIQRKLNTINDELDRFIMLTYPASYQPNNYILSSPIPVGELDMLDIHFDVSAVDDPAGDISILVCVVLLYGSDGSVWVLRNINYFSDVWDQTTTDTRTIWKQTDANFSTFRDGLQWGIFDDADHKNKTEWENFSINAAPTPIDGEIRLHFFAANQFSGTPDTFRIRYQNIRVDIYALIAGTYKKYTGQYQKVTRATDPTKYFGNIDKEVFISDSPRPAFKGAMFWYNGTNYKLVSRFYTAAPFLPGYPPSTDYLHRYGYIQIYSVWNQYRLTNRIIEGSVIGLGNSWIDLITKVQFTDVEQNINNRFFIVISFEQDWKTGIWRGEFLQVYKTDEGKVYTDINEFKYITT